MYRYQIVSQLKIFPFSETILRICERFRFVKKTDRERSRVQVLNLDIMHIRKIRISV